jgi:hypothetical protein
MATIAGVRSLRSKNTSSAAQVSRDGRTAYATVDFTRQSGNLAKADVTRVIDAAEAAREPGLDVQLGGQAIGNTEQPPLSLGRLLAPATTRPGTYRGRRGPPRPRPGSCQTYGRRFWVPGSARWLRRAHRAPGSGRHGRTIAPPQ